MRKPAQILLKIPFAVLGLGFGAIKAIRPVVTTGFHLCVGLLSTAIGAIIHVASKNKKDEEKKKIQKLEKFFMSDSFRNRNPRHKIARERFDFELRSLRDSEREKKRRFGRIDGAWRLISVGAGLLVGGVVFDALNPIAGVGIGLVVGGAIGWVGAIINNYVAKNAEAKTVAIVPPRETIKAPSIEKSAMPNGRDELVQKILLEAATALQKLDNNIAKLRHPDSIASVTQLVRTGKRLMDHVADAPEKMAVAQRVFTYYCPESVSVAEALAKIENDTKPDANRILSTQGVLQKLVVLFEKTELELKADDNKSLDIDLKLLDQSLQSDLVGR